MISSNEIVQSIHNFENFLSLMILICLIITGILVTLELYLFIKEDKNK